MSAFVLSHSFRVTVVSETDSVIVSIMMEVGVLCAALVLHEVCCSRGIQPKSHAR